jgi:hypothetical protein
MPRLIARRRKANAGDRPEIMLPQLFARMIGA